MVVGFPPRPGAPDVPGPRAVQDDTGRIAIPGITYPPPVFLAAEDQLVVNVRSSVATQLQLTARLLRTNGKMIDVDIFLGTTGTARALQTFKQGIGIGFLLHASVTAAGAATTPKRGQCLVSLQISRPVKDGLPTKWSLAQDYLTSQNGVLWPSGRMIAGVEGPGVLRSVNIANPAAGADWNQTVPTGARWTIRSGEATLTTGAAVANRQVIIVVDDGVNALFANDSAAVQAASLGVTYDFAQGQTITAAIAGRQPLFLPPGVTLLGGWRLRTQTGSIQAADQWSAINLMVEEWIED